MSHSVAKQSALNSVSIGATGSGYGAIPGTVLGGYGISAGHEFDEGIDIRITPAAGGYIVSINHRNIGKRPDLHIVTDDKDIGAEIGKIITMSCLKKE